MSGFEEPLMTLSGLSAVFFCHKAALMSRNDGETAGFPAVCG